MVGKKSNSRRRIDLWIIWGKFKNSYRKQDKGSTEVFSPGKHKKDTGKTFNCVHNWVMQ